MSQLDHIAACEEYRKAIALDSTFGLAYYRLAYAYTWGHAVELAKKPLAKAIELIDRIPTKEKYLLRALSANIEKGRAAAIPVVKEMERYYPDDKEMLFYIGDLSYHEYQHQQAIEYFEKVLAIDPSHERTLLHLPSAYNRTNQHEKVESALERLAKLNPGKALEEKGSYFFSQGEYEIALEVYRQSLKVDSTDWNVFQMMAFSYARMGRFEQALESAQQWQKRISIARTYWIVYEGHMLL